MLKRFACCAILAGSSLGIFAASAHAQCKDSWVTQAVKQIHSERGLSPTINAPTPTTGECDINRYAGGHWTSYADLLNHVRGAYVCNDPWIGQALADINHQVIGNGIVGDCNVKLYGSWSSYDQLKQLARQAMAKYPAGVCRDAWITQAVTEYKAAHGRKWPANQPSGGGETGECNMYLYGNGSWSNYGQLKQLVTTKFDQMGMYGNSISADNTITTRSGTIPASDQLVVDNKGNVLSAPSPTVIQNSKLIPAAKQELLTKGTLTDTIKKVGVNGLCSTNGGNVIAAGAGNVIAAGAGNVIAAGAGNVIAAGAGNIVGVSSGRVIAAGAGN